MNRISEVFTTPINWAFHQLTDAMWGEETFGDLPFYREEELRAPPLEERAVEVQPTEEELDAILERVLGEMDFTPPHVLPTHVMNDLVQELVRSVNSFSALFSHLNFKPGIHPGPDEDSEIKSFPSNLRIYLNSNEYPGEIEQQLKTLPANGDTFIGTSSLYCIKLFLLREPMGVRNLINIDPQEQFGDFWKLVEECLKRTDSPEDFSEDLLTALETNHEHFYSKTYLDLVKGISVRPFDEVFPFFLQAELGPILEFLKEGDHFARFKALFDEGRFVYLPIDLANPEAGTPEIRAVLEERGHSVDFLYVSNVAQYVQPERHESYLTNIANLSSNGNAPILHSIQGEAMEKKYQQKDMQSRGKPFSLHLMANSIDEYRDLLHRS